MAVVINKPQSQKTEKTLLEKLLYPLSKDGAPTEPWPFAIVATIVIGIALYAYRMYQEANSFTVGLDYFEPEFQTYWMSLFYIQMTVIPVLGAAGVLWLWFSRDKNVQTNCSAEQELGHYMFLFAILAVASLFVVTALTIFTEADAAWHQVTIRDTDFTPTHIALFYGIIPLLASGIVIAFVWVHTRLPYFVNRVSVPLAIAASAPLLIMPNLGYNEWGHTFFYAEELFAAPVHYGFVVLGWGLFGIAGFIIQCIQRVATLTKVTAKNRASAQYIN